MHHQHGNMNLPQARQPKKRVVIVDDSRTLRSWLRAVLESDPRLEVVGEAETALAARDVIRRTAPDVITLDIEMPGMNGLDFLKRLMVKRPMPVVMISGATRANSDATITALSLGAVDCLLKPGKLTNLRENRAIARRVFSAACSTVQRQQSSAERATPASGLSRGGIAPIILIGSSTGGVAALETVLGGLPGDGPPVVIAQHMPAFFLVSFARMLDGRYPQDVAIAQDDQPLEHGQVRLAPAMGLQTEVRCTANRWRTHLVKPERKMLHCPSVDVLFHSAVDSARQVVGVILTGLGKDGASGLKALRDNGAKTFGQDAESSVVYGMPRAAFEAGAVARQLPLSQIGGAAAGAAERIAGRIA